MVSRICFVELRLAMLFFTPYWLPDARAAITGLTRDTTAAHITRAALEAQAYQTLDLMDAMEKDSDRKPAVIRADGGLVSNQFVCQFLANMLDKPIEISSMSLCTSCAGLT